MSGLARMRVAGVGAGYFSRFHYDSWRRLSPVELVAVCDRDVVRAEAVGVRAFDDLAEMLAALQPDLMDVVLPPAEHAAAIRAGLKAGVGWIICQKPFCTGRDQAQAVVADAQAAAATLVVHENFRFQPWYRVIKAALDDGVLGAVHQMTFRLRPGTGRGRTPIWTGSRISDRWSGSLCARRRCIGWIRSGICWASQCPSMPICGG